MLRLKPNTYYQAFMLFTHTNIYMLHSVIVCLFDEMKGVKIYFVSGLEQMTLALSLCQRNGRIPMVMIKLNFNIMNNHIEKSKSKIGLATIQFSEYAVLQ